VRSCFYLAFGYILLCPSITAGEIMWPYPKVIAHRGGGILAPENTIAAMQCGLDHGFHAVEFDVMLSKALVCAKDEAPDIPRGFLIDQIKPGWLDALQELDAVALHTNQKYLTAAMAEQIKLADYGLLCYTVNTPERAAEICGWGVDAFCTDRIDLIPANF
jgi:glycerophosphoryl diester phosphodiesterase